MAYTGHHFLSPEFVLNQLRAKHGWSSLVTTSVVRTTNAVTATSWTNVQAISVTSDALALCVYWIDPNYGVQAGKLRVRNSSGTVAEMSVFGSDTGDNFLVGRAFDDNHQDNCDFLLFGNGDTVYLDAWSQYGGSTYAGSLYFQFNVS